MLNRMFGRDPVPKLLAAALGFLVWGAVAVAAGGLGPDGAFRLREAWDSPLYWQVGSPALASALLAMGWLWPRGAWRWAGCAAAGQAIAMVVFAPGGSGLGLLPLALISVLLVSLPLLAPAYLGALAQRLFGGGPPPPARQQPLRRRAGGLPPPRP